MSKSEKFMEEIDFSLLLEEFDGDIKKASDRYNEFINYEGGYRSNADVEPGYFYAPYIPVNL